jgi:type IX secretion system PorP/SprF family membrane protein
MKYFGITILMLSNYLLIGQVNSTSQFLTNPLLINPGFTGYYDAMSANGMFRFQSLGVEGSPRTQSISFHSPINPAYVGVGLHIINETAAVYDQLNVLASGSYKIQYNSITISSGLQAGFRTTESSFSQLSTRQPNDPVYQTDVKTTSFSFGAGIYAYDDKFAFGFSVPELIDPSDEHQEFSRSALLMGSYLFEINRDLKVKPGALLSFAENRRSELNINCSVILRDVVQAGLAYRTNGSITTLFQLFVTDQLQLTYTYDAFVNEISSVSYGSHEIGIQYLFKFSRSNVLSPRYF